MSSFFRSFSRKSNRQAPKPPDVAVAGAITGYKFTNWAGTFSCSPELYFTPSNTDELKQILIKAHEKGKHVRAVGCGHSPSDIACTSDYMISLKRMNKLLRIDRVNRTVKAEAGITLKDLDEVVLPQFNLALSVHGSVADITLGGAISTGTHASGMKYGGLATYVIDLELMTWQGQVLFCSREENKEVFLSALCGLGAIGIIVTINLQCEAAFNLREVQQPVGLDELFLNLRAYIEKSDYFRFVYYPHTNGALCYHITKTDQVVSRPSVFRRAYNWVWDYGVGYYMLEFLYWIGTFYGPVVPVVNKTYYNMLFSKKREATDTSYKVFNFECLFKQYANEWAIPWEKAEQVIRELKQWIDTTPGAYIHYSVEVRFVKGDDIYISPAYGRDSCYINIVMYRPYGRTMPYQKFWDAYENIMKKAGGRPHWAKAHRVGASEFQRLYPQFSKWMDVRNQMDPHYIFVNQYLERIFMS